MAVDKGQMNFDYVIHKDSNLDTVDYNKYLSKVVAISPAITLPFSSGLNHKLQFFQARKGLVWEIDFLRNKC